MEKETNAQKLIMTILAINTFVVLGVGVTVNSYLVNTEKRLTAIETKIMLLHREEKHHDD